MTEKTPLIALTGATGFLGSHLLCQALQSGFSVRAAYRSDSARAAIKPIADFYGIDIRQPGERLIWIKGDIEHPDFAVELTDGADYVWHSAAFVSFAPGDSQKLYSVNVTGTENLVNACLANGVTKLIHVSSIATLGQANEHGITDENCHLATLKGRSGYGRTKYLAEMAVWRAAEEGLDMAIVNPSVILGPGHAGMGTMQLFEMAQGGMYWYIDGVNGFVDVRDVAAAIVWLTTAPVKNERFVLNGYTISYRSLFETLSQASNQPPPRRRVPTGLLKTIAVANQLLSLFTRKSPAINSGVVDAARGTLRYNSDKWLNISKIGFTPIMDTIHTTSRFIKNLPSA